MVPCVWIYAIIYWIAIDDIHHVLMPQKLLSKSHKIILFAWYRPARLVSFCPQNPEETARTFFRLGTLTHEIFYVIVHEKFLELAIALYCQCLVVCGNQCRFIYLLDDVCYRKGFSRAGDANKRLRTGCLPYENVKIKKYLLPIHVSKNVLLPSINRRYRIASTFSSSFLEHVF